jgi:hypothetical protein
MKVSYSYGPWQSFLVVTLLFLLMVFLRPQSYLSFPRLLSFFRPFSRVKTLFCFAKHVSVYPIYGLSSHVPYLSSYISISYSGGGSFDHTCCESSGARQRRKYHRLLSQWNKLSVVSPTVARHDSNKTE